jgi:hypothetical protein
MTDLKKIAGWLTSLAIIFTAFVTVETRYAKADDLEQLLRSQEQKIVWDLEENIDTSDEEDQAKWFKRLREKVAAFCADYPLEDECDEDYLDEIEEDMESDE